ncbi:MAG: 2-succinyl-5-enolpyruvyl-6-hydroxy-3-cyclohexene-1-carboxylic-acid synthase [Actinomycetota bacterium]|nr:2-succinyl-5-enolpyruvyl-6-hydroxy-3-cyclohexene-1-carboxylic-acid synthase [Actinomycetota bacterium]
MARLGYEEVGHHHSGGGPLSINAGQALAQVLVDELVRSGMTDACLAPGSRSTPLVLALSGRPELRLHVSIDERSCAFLALGIAKEQGRPVGVVTTSGTATANLYPAVIEAHHSAVPLILLTADRPPEARDTGAGQTIDQIKLYGGAVRWFVEVGPAEDRAESVPYWRSISARAYQVSAGPHPGPVHLNLAFRKPFVGTAGSDAFSHDLAGRADGKPWVAASPATELVTEEELLRLKDDFEGEERGIIVAGTGDLDPEPVLSLARSLQWPVLAEATSNARARFPAISAYDALLRHKEFAASHRPELVLRLGNLGTSQALDDMLGPSVRQIAVAPQGRWLDPRRAISWVIRSSPERICRVLAQLVTPKRETAWLGSWAEAERVARTVIDRTLDEHEEVTEPRVARDLAEAVPDGGALVVSSSMPIRDLDWFMRPREGISIHANRGANGIDGFVSTTLGVAIGHSGPTFALCGDLALLHDQNGLLTSPDGSVDAVFVVLNNNGGGIFSFLPESAERHFERLFATPHNRDLSLVAQAHRCGYRLLDKAAELQDAMMEAAEAGGVQILEARTERSSNVRIHREVWGAVRDALGGE